jgi:glutamyl-tRNA synthetase
MNDPKTIRVRFAPSPTGYLHLGGLRTALFNYLYSRSCGGKFILRVEDTDQARYVEGALKNLLDIFEWLGMEFDEGPNIGGEYGPYIQSQRLEIYHKYCRQLLTDGNAYRCFCQLERLEEMRKRQIAAKKLPRYDRKCREIPDIESKKRAQMEPFVVRLKIPLSGEIKFFDGVRGEVSFEAEGIDDQVLMKTDGFPTYHLANVVDDYLMKISDVIRGEEWLPSTPKHIQIYRYLEWELPRFYHLPLILNPDRSKLSKRQGDVGVEDYRAKGYLPEGLINYVALLGWHPSDEKEFFTKEELIRTFSLTRITRAGAIFDIDKLNWLNGEHLKALTDEEFIQRGKEFIPEGIDFTIEVGKKVLKSVREGLARFSGIPEKLKPFNWNWNIEDLSAEAQEVLTKESSQIVYKAILRHKNETQQWDSNAFKDLMNLSGSEAGMKGKDLWMSVRAATTGSIHGPEMVLISEYIGKERFFYHIERATKLNKGSKCAS